MPLVAIVGRPNVGKSTFFNRLTESRQSIVHDEPGVTRDRIYGRAEWNGRVFDVVDTGGYVPRSAERFDAAIREQVDIALEEADAVIFVADVLTGVTDLDGEIGKMLLRADTPVFVAVNKSDTPERRWDASEFWTLGIDHVFPISSITGSGTGDLLDAVVDALPEEDEEEDDEAVRIAVIGRPNVGKSSLVNALLGYERNIVTEISGTTRDATDARLEVDGQEIVLVDTAGLRKKSRVRENVEFYSTLRTERALRDGDVCVLVLDATLGIEKQDVHVLFEAAKFKKGLVVVLNKWDLIEDKDTFTARDYERQIRAALAPIDYVPLITISALTQQRIQRIIPTALEVAERRKQRIPTSKLNDMLTQAVQRAHPPTWRGAYVQIKFAQQVREEPPVIAFFCNHPEGVKENYKRYLENQLREAFDFEGVPLTLAFRKK